MPQVPEQRDKFEEERNEILEIARKGLDSNIPLKPVQKKYLKNLLLYALMSASANKSVSKKNFKGLVKRLFKKFIAKILRLNLGYDDEYWDENLEVELNNIIANEQRLNLQNISNSLSPKNIIAQIRQTSEGINARAVLAKLLALREAKANHRETPEELRERQQRQRKYQRQRERQNVRSLERGARER